MFVSTVSGWVGVHEVMQQEFGKAGGFATSHYPGATRPVDSASWNDAKAFCDSLDRIGRDAGRLPPATPTRCRRASSGNCSGAAREWRIRSSVGK